MPRAPSMRYIYIDIINRRPALIMLTKTTCGKRALNVRTPGELAHPRPGPRAAYARVRMPCSLRRTDSTVFCTHGGLAPGPPPTARLRLRSTDVKVRLGSPVHRNEERKSLFPKPCLHFKCSRHPAAFGWLSLPCPLPSSPCSYIYTYIHIYIYTALSPSWAVC